MDKNIPFYFGFSMFNGIGPVHFAKLMEVFPDAEYAFTAAHKELLPILGELLTSQFLSFRKNFDPIAQYASLLKKGIQYIHQDSSQYPINLRSISDPPIGLFVMGNPQALNPLPLASSSPSSLSSPHPLFLAIVGTRRPSHYGEHIAKKFSFELASYGFTIVSGLAVGIDSIAHGSALEANGSTVAVLGCGVGMIPPSKEKLYTQIISSGGAIISEFPPTQFVLKGFFVTRNRIVSGMSDGVLVVEGTDKSGTLITAKYAAAQGRDVFAPPVPITSDLSQAPNILLKQGAKLVTCVEDILEEYSVTTKQKTAENLLNNRTANEQKLISALLSQPLSPDDLSQKTGFPITTILTIITMLEIEGIVIKQNDGLYALR